MKVIIEDVKLQLGLNKKSRVLLINTEGNTDPENYLKVITNSQVSK